MIASSNSPHYFIRHGESGAGDHLTDIGITQAETARDYLLAEGLGAAAILLSSPAVRTQETAGIVGAGLGVDVQVVEKLSDLSKDPDAKRLDENGDVTGFISSLEREFLDGQEGGRLIVVTHLPLISKVLYDNWDFSDIKNGRVVKWPKQVEIKPQRTKFKLLQGLRKPRA